MASQPLTTCLLGCLFFFVVATTMAKEQVYHRVLDNYVWSASPEYSYQVVSTQTNDLATVYVINMTSVNWLGEKEMGPRAHWFHYLEVAVPKNLDKTLKQGLLYITNGYTSPSAPTGDTDMSYLANSSRTICTALHQVPNQFLAFNSDPNHKEREEDGIIAYAWMKFMANTTNYEWIPRLPMVKASVLAMDTVQAFAKKQLKVQINTFTVSGASKRGWTGK